jgi:Coenzyme PQQ synthesis protein D (PqqD)
VRRIYTRASQVLHRNAGPDVLALLPGLSDVHLMAGPAALMWDLLAEEVAFEDLADELAQLYARPVEEIVPSLESYLQDLARRGLVEERID